MAEIYVDYTSPIKTKIFWNGEITNPDEGFEVINVTVWDVTEDPTQDPLVDPSLPIFETTAEKVESDNGTYQFVLPLNLCDRAKNLRIRWQYIIGGNNAGHYTNMSIVKPYVGLAEVYEDLGFGTDYGDPDHKTFHELQMAEKYARKVIENFCNQVFYPYNDFQVVYGAGTNLVPLPFKLLELHELYENDIKIIDNINNINNWSYQPKIVESGFGLRVDQSSQVDGIVYTANGLVPPTVNDWGFGGAFKKDSRYRIQGRYGWNDVPDNVEEACIVLMKDFFSKDVAWKNKYIKNIQTFDWQFEFTGDAYRGTGNYYADQLLAPYVINGMLVI
jgi:hypothetical protein